MINITLLDEIVSSKSKLLAVTKYWNKNETINIISEIKKHNPNLLFGIGENRIEKIIEKDLPRESTHFIGNIQSKKIDQIIEYCSTIHSLGNLKHAQIIDTLSKEKGIITKVFLQVKLDNEKDSGINTIDFPLILEQIKKLENIKIIGISGMGAGEFSLEEKEKEFDTLVNLRDKYLPGKLISAGTSRDYKIALKYGIEVVRIGSKIIN
ncbi:hypothetical protein EOM39_06125 [Candidatus Gracilibacteria bacterium]|nr:hypothetical protein [Candidatus Gracilibacteria bacterium]